MGEDKDGVFRPRWLWFVEWTSDSEAVFRATQRVLAHEKTDFQEVMVVDSVELGRTLVIDGKVQSSLFDEYIYHESLVHPAMVSHGSPRKVLILGGGEGATLREALRYRTVQEAVMVDIDRKVVEFARKHLREWHKGSFDDGRVKLVFMDGRRFVEEAAAEGEIYDVIILDLVDPLEAGPAVRLYTKEFYAMVEKILAVPGLVATQATSHSFYPSVFARIYHTMKSVFGNTRSYYTCIRSFNGPWDFVIAYRGVDPASLSKDEINFRLNSLLYRPEELRFYDGETHTRLMMTPRNIKEILERYKGIATDSEPGYIAF